jgi:hypothetical protein
MWYFFAFFSRCFPCENSLFCSSFAVLKYLNVRSGPQLKICQVSG